MSTAAVWVDNSRKQLECRKRPGQFYLQTWHASIAIKPIGLQRGASFTKIARMVKGHDSRLIDLLVTNSKWVEDHAALGMLYSGKMLRTGSARVDTLINNRDELRKNFRQKYGMDKDTKIVMYAPTFRRGSQDTNRNPELQNKMPDFAALIKALEKRFGGSWTVVLRIHPQLTVRHISASLPEEVENNVIDASKEDDMCETLGAADVLITDYSVMTVDAAYIKIPVFLYVYDLRDYINDRGELMWNLHTLPFPFAENMEALVHSIEVFDNEKYYEDVAGLFNELEVKEDGNASKRIVDVIENIITL